MKDWFTVGEMATLFNLNVQTLHYYESIGLFRPVRRRESTGVRLYQFDQVYALATIRFLKKLEYPLGRIKSTMDSRDPALSLRAMREQSEELRVRCESLERIRRAIDRRIRYVEDRCAALDPDSVSIADIPLRRYIPIGLEEHLYGNDDFYFYPTVVFYTRSGKHFGAMLTGDPSGDGTGAAQEGESGAGGDAEAGRGTASDQDRKPGGDGDGGGEREGGASGFARTPRPREIPPGTFMVGYHRGPYERIATSFDRIRREGARRGLALDDGTVNLNIIDQFVERNSSNYITEVQIRIGE